MTTQLAAKTVAPSSATSRFTPGLRRLAGISASLVGTQALTSVLGLVFWTLAYRRFATSEAGVAGAAVSLMMLLCSLGSLGLGTLLIARLPATDPKQRRVLVRTSVLVAGVVSAALALCLPPIAVLVFHAVNLRPLMATPADLIGFALGCGLMGVVAVLDQAVLTIGAGTLQLERNVLASVVKIGALAAFGAAGMTGGMTIFLAWTVGSLVSLPLVSWRTRGSRADTAGQPWIDLRVLRGLGRMAISHHSLNITLQAVFQILPILVTVLLSARENAYFNSAVLVSGFVFALPYAVAIGLFASGEGREADVIGRMKLTLPISLVISLGAYLLLFPLAGVVLNVFGASFAQEGVNILRVLTLAGLPFVVKDHYVALRRVQGRTTDAVRTLLLFLVIELAAAVLGAHWGGTLGLCVGWCIVLFAEAIVLSVSLSRAWRSVPRLGHLTGPTEAAALLSSEVDPDSAVVAAGAASPAELASSVIVSEDNAFGGVPSMAVASTLLADAQAASSETAESAEFADPSDTARAGEPDRPVEPHRTRRPRNLVGPLLLVMACGMFLLSVAANESRRSSPTVVYQILWIAGLTVIIGPALVRVLLSSTGARERLTLAFAVPVVLQLSRLVLSPISFVGHDELLHSNTLRLIDESSHLYGMNPLLPVSSFYPGLEIVTDAIQRVTGLSAFVSAWIVLIIARMIMTLAVIGLIRTVTRSSRAAAVGSLLYLCNPQLLFFNSQFSYQTLALPLAVFTVYAFVQRRRGSRLALAWPLAGLAGVTAVHHLTAGLLVAAFAVWFLTEAAFGRRRIVAALRATTGQADEAGVARRMADRAGELKALAVMWLAGTALSLGAAVIPGNPVGPYLWSIATNYDSGVSGLAEGAAPKKVFSDSAGAGPAPWEQALLILSVLVAGLTLLLVLHALRTHFRARNVVATVLCLVALVYPVIPAGHLTVATAEVGDRASGFVYLGLGAIVGAFLAARRLRLAWALPIGALITAVFLGGVVLGSGPTARQLPGPYLVEADARSMDADNLAAANWESSNLPGDNHVYADRDSGLLASAVGGQFTVRHLSTGIDASRLLLDPKFTADDLDLIERADLSYLIVDSRLSQGLPHLDVYIENGEFDQARTGPVPAAALAKFSSIKGVSLIYDNGSIKIYDIRGLRHAD